ncbi:MAG: hypothetical protein ACYC9W_10420, partial [Candidatus Limnocylindria bacterium]
ATFKTICEGAAMQHGCTVEITEAMRLYEPANPDPVLTDLAVQTLEAHGAKDVRQGTLVTASTDLGNVSQRYPTVAFDFPVSVENVPGHSIKMTDASVSDYAHAAGATTAEAIAALTLALATDPAVRERLRR